MGDMALCLTFPPQNTEEVTAHHTAHRIAQVTAAAHHTGAPATAQTVTLETSPATPHLHIAHMCQV